MVLHVAGLACSVRDFETPGLETPGLHELPPPYMRDIGAASQIVVYPGNGTKGQYDVSCSVWTPRSVRHDQFQKFASKAIVQKNPRVRKIRVRNSGARNGCANFMDAWKNAFFLQENPCP